MVNTIKNMFNPNFTDELIVGLDSSIFFLSICILIIYLCYLIFLSLGKKTIDKKAILTKSKSLSKFCGNLLIFFGIIIRSDFLYRKTQQTPHSEGTMITTFYILVYSICSLIFLYFVIQIVRYIMFNIFFLTKSTIGKFRES